MSVSAINETSTIQPSNAVSLSKDDLRLMLDELQTIKLKLSALERRIENYLSESVIIETKIDLTNTEKEILKLIAEGKSNSEVAISRGCSENTVKVHLNNLFSKFGVHNRISLITKARELLLVN